METSVLNVEITKKRSMTRATTAFQRTMTYSDGVVGRAPFHFSAGITKHFL